MGDEVRRALPAMVRAFWDFPETVHLLPDEGKRRRVLPRYMSSDLQGAAAVDGLRVAERDGEVVGAVAFLPPGAYPRPWRRQLIELVHLAPVLPWGLHAAIEGQRGRKRNAAAHREHTEPHYFIEAMGVDPDHQRRGVGGELMASVLQHADNEGVGCFLFTATEANAAWYTSLGFTTSKRYNPTPTWPDVWAMWRAPR